MVDHERGWIMRLYDIACSACGAVYRVAESDTAVGLPGVQNCSSCGGILTTWCDRKLKVFRLEMSPEHRYAACRFRVRRQRLSEVSARGTGGAVIRSSRRRDEGPAIECQEIN